jgi:hypothetical protein
MHVAATVAGSSFYEVTFQRRVGHGPWRSIGTDDSAPYQVFDDVSTLTLKEDGMWLVNAHPHKNAHRRGKNAMPGKIIDVSGAAP